MTVPGYRLRGCGIHVLREYIFYFFPEKFAEKTLQLFVPNSKRLRSYTQCALHSEVLTRKLQHFSLKITRINIISTWNNLKKREGFRVQP
jgi:hypothetical protein